MRRTKILATIGPATMSEEALAGLVRAGADSFRLNFSHGSDAEHRAGIRRMHRVRERLGRPIPIVADVQGPKIRIGALTPEAIDLAEGASWTLDDSNVAGGSRRVGVRVPDLAHAARPGDPILIGDGGVELRVVRAGARQIRTRVVHGGPVRSHAGLFLPRAHLRTSVLGPRDRYDIELAVRAGVDFLAVSFVRDARDMRVARAALDRHPGGTRVGLIAKIERAEALESIDEILAATDAIMVARGDLGIEIPLERLPLAQKTLVRRANLAACPAIVATQMLLSMVHAPRPTRAEATDVANAVLDGADAVMLSEESAIGDYPSESVRWLARIAEATEGQVPPGPRAGSGPADAMTLTPEREVAAAAVDIARDLAAKAIVTPTHSGRSATLISSLRPQMPIVALSAVAATRLKLGLVWGVRTEEAPPRRTLSDLRERAERIGGEIDPSGGRVVLTAGYPVEGRPTNLVTVVDYPAATSVTRSRASRPDGRGARSPDRRTRATGGARS